MHFLYNSRHFNLLGFWCWFVWYSLSNWLFCLIVNSTKLKKLFYPIAHCRSCEVDEITPPRFGNMMHDRRVIRGSTYARQIVPMDVSIYNSTRLNMNARDAWSRDAWIEDAWIEMHGSRCMDRDAWIEMHGSRCIDRDAWIEMHWSRCMDRDAWIEMHRSKCMDRKCMDRDAWIEMHGSKWSCINCMITHWVWNRKVFRCFLKENRDMVWSWSSEDRLFQVEGPEITNPLIPEMF